MSRDIVRCTAVQQGTVTIGMPGWDDPLYEEADGRLFSVGSQTSMGTYRNTAVWADVLDQAGELEGKTIGVVTSEDFGALSAGTEEALVPHLEELGYEVAEFASLPCPEGDNDCEQHEPTMQTFKDAGVDLVFMNAGAARRTRPVRRRDQPRLPPAVGHLLQQHHRHRRAVRARAPSTSSTAPSG